MRKSASPATPAEVLGEVTLTVDLLVLGYAAVMYAAKCPACPQRHWGAGLSSGHSLRIGNDRYRFTDARRNRGGGLTITRDIDHFMGGKGSTVLWLPWESLANLTVSTSGVVLS